MKKRNLILFVLMMLFVPFYSLYWLIRTQTYFQRENDDELSWAGVIILSIITLGIYGIIWNVKTYNSICRYNRIEKTANAGLIIASIFVPIVTIAFTQVRMNEVIDGPKVKVEREPKPKKEKKKKPIVTEVEESKNEVLENEVSNETNVESIETNKDEEHNQENEETAVIVEQKIETVVVNEVTGEINESKE